MNYSIEPCVLHCRPVLTQWLHLKQSAQLAPEEVLVVQGRMWYLKTSQTLSMLLKHLHSKDLQDWEGSIRCSWYGRKKRKLLELLHMLFNPKFQPSSQAGQSVCILPWCYLIFYVLPCITDSHFSSGSGLGPIYSIITSQAQSGGKMEWSNFFLFQLPALK